MAGNKDQANTTHITLLLDASLSMRHLTDSVVKVVDGLMAKWAKQSLEMDDMTRLTVYQFSSQGYLSNGKGIECIWYDTDITRIKTIEGRYTPRGNTALIDATMQAKQELELTPTLYGDHAFLFFVVTDGEENCSQKYNSADLSKALGGLPDNWTMAALVPHIQGKIDAKRYGIPQGNIMVWDATSEAGVEEAGERIAAATTSYLKSRTTTGMRSTTSLFVGAQVDAQAIKAANLVPLGSNQRKIAKVVKTDDSFEKEILPANSRRSKPVMGWFVKIEDYVKRINKGEYPLGDAFYELVKPETVTGDKEIAVQEVSTSKVFVGPGARQLLGLPEERRRVKPDMNPDYTIFIQSNSLNRHLPHGCQVMVLNR